MKTIELHIHNLQDDLVMDCKKCHEEAICKCGDCEGYFCHSCHETCALCERPVCKNCWYVVHRHTTAEMAAAPAHIAAPHM